LTNNDERENEADVDVNDNAMFLLTVAHDEILAEIYPRMYKFLDIRSLRTATVGLRPLGLQALPTVWGTFSKPSKIFESERSDNIVACH